MIEYDAAPVDPDAVPRLEDENAEAREIQSRAGALPPHAQQFVMIPGRFDGGNDPVRNLRFGRVTLHEGEGGSAAELLLRGYPQIHTTDLVITYYGLVAAALTPGAADTNVGLLTPTALGRSLSDRILPDPRGCLHEIQFAGGALTVTAADIAASWVPINSRG